MSTPEAVPHDAEDDEAESTVPEVAPAYSTPPPEGIPDAEDG
jgi:hypothetical protein